MGSASRSSVLGWVPIPDLSEFLNGLPGPALTLTDIQQRLTAMEEEDRWTWAREELRDGCLDIYHRERAEGTELPAIIGMLRGATAVVRRRLRLDAASEFAELALPHQRQSLPPVPHEGSNVGSRPGGICGR